MAEGILKKRLTEKGVDFIHVKSAGIMAPERSPATQSTRDVAIQQGVDLSEHMSRFLTAALVHEADIVLVMERVHQKEIEEWFHPDRKKIFLLKSFGPDGMDEEVDDPIGCNREVYELCFQTITSEIDRIFPELLNLCQNTRSDGDP